jgi:hypothetical protein
MRDLAADLSRIVKDRFKNKQYMVLADATRIDEVVPLPKHGIMANEFILDFAECIGAFPADLIDLVEDAGGDV